MFTLASSLVFTMLVAVSKASLVPVGYTPSNVMRSIESRQTNLCTQTCVQSCHVFGNVVPDCSQLISTINNLGGQNFTAPPGITTVFESGNCQLRFFHSQAESITGCFSWLEGLLPTMNACLGASGTPQNAGECTQQNADFAFTVVLAHSGALDPPNQ